MLRKEFYIFVFIMLYVINSGCAAVVVGAGVGTGVAWYKGKLEETVSASVPQVHRAVKAGLRDLNITITEDRHDTLTAEVRGELADGKNVSIDAKSIGTSTTKLTIRVGTFGDKDFSLRIRDAIKNHL
jgi:hypothetical protein